MTRQLAARFLPQPQVVKKRIESLIGVFGSLALVGNKACGRFTGLGLAVAVQGVDVHTFKGTRRTPTQ